MLHIDQELGVVDPTSECTCSTSIAGDHIVFFGCARHGVKEFCVTECCYCKDDCKCGWSELDSQQLKFVAVLNSTLTR